jgi:enoyl-CoA hydratase
MSDDLVRYERRGAVAIITINRPQTLNALDMPTLAALDARVAAAEADDGVRVLVFTGAGRAFVAGGDIADLNARQGLPHYQELAERLHRVFRRIEVCDKPTIAAVNGWALGGGTELLLCMDLRIAASSAKLGLPEITLGLFPGAGGSQRLLRQLPLCKAKELMFLGNRITADEAERLGLINRVVADAALMQETLAIADAIAQKSPLVLKLLKRTMADGADMPLPSALRHEQAMISLVFDSADAHEGCSAFLEKRAAAFHGR